MLLVCQVFFASAAISRDWEVVGEQHSIGWEGKQVYPICDAASALTACRTAGSDCGPCATPWASFRVRPQSATVRPESRGQWATGPDRLPDRVLSGLITAMRVHPHRSSKVEAFSGRLSPLPKSRFCRSPERSRGGSRGINAVPGRGINTAPPGLPPGGVGHASSLVDLARGRIHE